jgi:DNA-directed RNA polymerase specialized sigma24 family protein
MLDDEKRLPDEFFDKKIMDELQRLARLVRWRGGVSDTLQTGVLVSELWLKYRNHPEIANVPDEERRGKFVRALQQIVRDAWRRKSAEKRMEGGEYVSPENLTESTWDDGFEIFLTYKPIMAKLIKLNPRAAQAFLHVFDDGMTVKEIAAKLQVSTSSVERDLKTARAFLVAETKRKRGT